MDSATKSFNVSTKINLTENLNPQPSLTKRARKYLRNPRFVFFSLLILLKILASAIVLSSILRNQMSPSFQTYLSKTRKYYCKLTPHRRLCYESLSSVINVTALTSNPGLIFSASIQVSINQLNNTTVAIAKALSLTRNNSAAGSSFLSCKAWVLDSLSQLNKSLTALGVDSDVRSLTYVEMDNIRVSNVAASANALNCYRALQEVAVGEEKTRVKEVKSGVWKASRMPPKRDIGWDYGTPIGDGRKNIKCKFCDKVITGGITRLKQHIAHVIGNIESCKKVPKEVSIMMKKHLK